MKYWQISLAISAALSASFALADDFKTVAGKEYKNATVSRVEADGIVIKFHDGIAKIFFVELPPEIQKKYGYDPEAEMKQKARAANLMSQAESALRADQFEKDAELLNQIVSGYPASPQAQTVLELRSFLRDKQPAQDGPLTPSEAKRLREVMDAFVKIKQNYRTATPEKRRALETILGAETFRDTDDSLSGLASPAAKLRDSRDKALRGE